MTTALATRPCSTWIQAVSEYAASDAEVMATVTSLMNSGRVLLCGNFAGAKIDF